MSPPCPPTHRRSQESRGRKEEEKVILSKLAVSQADVLGLRAQPAAGGKAQGQELERFTLPSGNSMGVSFGETGLAVAEG